MKRFDSGLLCGRFQTFHLGHSRLLDMGLSLCDRMFVLVGSSQESGTERNPFNISTRIKMIKEIYGDNPNVYVYGLPDLTTEDDITPAWGYYLFDNLDRYLHKPPELMIYGNDESRSNWFDKECIKKTCEFIVSRDDKSATNVRYLMAIDERKAWMELVDPRLHKMYDELRAELMEIPFYQNIAKVRNNYVQK